MQNGYCGVAASLALMIAAPGPVTTGAPFELGQPGAIRVRLQDVAASAGLDFVHRHSPTPEKHYVESVPGGLAVFDYNGDGRPDV
jgi:hypothetical protein